MHAGGMLPAALAIPAVLWAAVTASRMFCQAMSILGGASMACCISLHAYVCSLLAADHLLM